MELDLTGLKCPLPILKTKKVLANLNTGDILTVQVTDPHAPDDFSAFCRQTGHVLLEQKTSSENIFIMTIQHK